jgi:hypothetical protein
MVCGKTKDCPRERNLREIYTENTIMSVFLCCFCLHITAYEQIRGEGAQNFLGPRGVKYLNTGLPVCISYIGKRYRKLGLHAREANVL